MYSLYGIFLLLIKYFDQNSENVPEDVMEEFHNNVEGENFLAKLWNLAPIVKEYFDFTTATYDRLDFFRACYDGNLEEIKRIIRKGTVDININYDHYGHVVHSIIYHCHGNDTCRHEACVCNHIECVKFLVSHRDFSESIDKCLLSSTKSDRNLELTKWLIHNQKADPFYCDEFPNNSLTNAIRFNCVETVSYLLEKFPELATRKLINEDGYEYPLIVAVKRTGYNDTRILEMLLSNKFDINLNVENSRGETALSIAIDGYSVRDKDFKILNCLIKAGIDLNKPNSEGYLPSIYIREHYSSGVYDDLLQFLKDKGVDLKKIDNYGKTFKDYLRECEPGGKREDLSILIL